VLQTGQASGEADGIDMPGQLCGNVFCPAKFHVCNLRKVIE